MSFEVFVSVAFSNFSLSFTITISNNNIKNNILITSTTTAAFVAVVDPGMRNVIEEPQSYFISICPFC